MKKLFWIPIVVLSLALAACGNNDAAAREAAVSGPGYNQGATEERQGGGGRQAAPPPTPAGREQTSESATTD